MKCRAFVQTTERNRSRVFERHVRRLRDDRLAGGQLNLLTVGAELQARRAVDGVPHRNARSLRANGRDLSGGIAAENRPARPQRPERESKRLARTI